jgi:outer membrane lipoprotein-sorting protein
VTAFGMQGQEEPELLRALKKMNEIAKDFRTYSAEFSQKKYTAVLEEFDIPETGKFYYALDRNGSVLMRHQIENPGDRILTIKDGEAVIFNRAIKQAQIYKLGNRQEFAQYLTLGIGQSSEKLREKFNISYGGSESINGEPCAILVLKPKDPQVTRYLTSITIWLKKPSGTPAQYRFLEPNDDYLLETFSDERINENIDDSAFEQKLPKGVEKIRLQ